MMDTKSIGNIGEAKTLCKFVELGLPVYRPFGDNGTADVIVEFNGKLNKIQVKTSTKAEDGAMIFDLTSPAVYGENGARRKYTPDEVDYFVCYNIERDKLFMIPVENTDQSVIVIRYEAPKNNQKSNINWEDDYLFENVFKTYIA